MIDFLTGTLTDKRETYAIVGVGGVGFRVNIPLSTYRELPRSGEAVHLFTVLIVREDDMKLFGFATETERDLFNILSSLSGVGGKLAMDILSYVPAMVLAQAVQRNEPALLCQAPGVGKKRAEKIIFELSRQKHPLLLSPIQTEPGGKELPVTDASQEAHEALLALGLKPADAQRTLSRAVETLGAEADVSALIKEALKYR